MSDVLLRTFQLRTRVAQLSADGVLVGEWDRVVPEFRPAYRSMVSAMARAGVDTRGRPPMWAWFGPLLLLDAAMLYDADHELSAGCATIEFEAPAALVVGSDYRAWNDYLESVFHRKPVDWLPDPPPIRAPAGRSGCARPGGHLPEQICLPYLRAGWVRDVRPLPTTGWGELDVSRPA